jgi:23S rRNA maturation mini-RNase III
LTTLGYGDILPVSMWARSFASIEAVIGVLYVTIIMARLVSLYTAGQAEESA